MPHVIGCDAHKKFSVFVTVDEHGRVSQPMRVEHDREAYRRFLQRLPGHSEIALEACGFWYWMVDEMEAAGHVPRLANPTESKKCMGQTPQARPAGCQRLEHPLAQRHAAGVLDSAETAPRSTRTPAALADGTTRSAHESQAPHPWGAGAVRPADDGLHGSLRQNGSCVSYEMSDGALAANRTRGDHAGGRDGRAHGAHRDH